MAAGFGDDAGKLLKQAQDIQKRMEAAKRDLSERVVEGSAGGGVVKIQITGDQQLQGLSIAPEAVDPEDVSGLEDLIQAALRQALQASKELQRQVMGQVTGGLNLPGMGF